MILPTQKQIENCAAMGWAYEGDGVFTKPGWWGWFTTDGFYKEIFEA